MATLRKIPAAYIITHEPTGMFYIGSTGKIGARWSGHRYDLSNNRHKNKKLQSVFTEIGDYSLEVLSIGTLEEVRTTEQRLLDRYLGDELCCNTAPNAMNSLAGRTPEETAEVRQLIFNSPKWQTAIRQVQKLAAAANRGRAPSKETLEKLAEGRARKPHPRLGKVHSDEQKAKYMRSITEYRNSPEYTDYKTRVSEAKSKPLSIDGVVYKNIKAAALALGLNPNCVKVRITSKNPKFKTWFRLSAPKQ